MRGRKKVIIIIITIIILLLLAGGTFAFLFLKKDLFKYTQQMFYKYALQNIDEIKQMITSQDSLDEQKNYITNGNVKVSFEEESLKLFNNFQITEEGKSDVLNQKSVYNVNLKYGDEDIITTEVLKKDNLYGITSKEVLNGGYIIAEDNNLRELAAELGVENANILPNSISDIFNFDINSIDINPYLNIIYNNISKENFSKEKDMSILYNQANVTVDSYKLNLTQGDINNLKNLLLNQLKEDQNVLNILGVSREDIDKIQANTNNTTINNTKNYEIIMYIRNDKVIRYNINSIENNSTVNNIVVDIDGTNNFNITINNNINESRVELKMTNQSGVSQQTYQININLYNKELQVFNLQIWITNALKGNGETNEITINLQDIVNFVISINKEYTEEQLEIPDLTKEGNFVINEQSSENINKLNESLQKEIISIIRKKLISIVIGEGTDTQNPTQQGDESQENIPTDNEQSNNNQVGNNQPNDDNSQAQVIDKDVFNVGIQSFEGEQENANIQAAISKVMQSNLQYADKKIGIILKTREKTYEIPGEQLTREIEVALREAFDITKVHIIKAQYDNEGYINMLEISEKID